MHEMKKIKGSLTRLRTRRWRLAILVIKMVFRKEQNFVYFLKALGMSDIFCVRALEFGYGVDNRAAKTLVARFIAKPFIEPKI